MNLRTFPSTAGEAISSSSRLILLSRAVTRKTTSCIRRTVSFGTLYIVEVGDLAAVVGSAAAKVSLALQESSWADRESVPLASLDPAGAESSRRGSVDDIVVPDRSTEVANFCGAVRRFSN
jgi:hypothetical protein